MSEISNLDLRLLLVNRQTSNFRVYKCLRKDKAIQCKEAWVGTDRLTRSGASADLRPFVLETNRVKTGILERD